MILQPTRNMICKVILLTFATLVLASVDCDSKLQQHDDAPQEDSKPTPDLGHTSEQAADPELIKRELKKCLLDQVDLDKNGYVSYEELKKYLAVLHDKTIDYNVEKQWRYYSPHIHEVFSWEGYEPERKEVLTWDHYYNQTYPELQGVDVGIPMTREQDTSRILSPDQQTTEKSKESDANKKLGDDETLDAQSDHLKTLKLMVQRADVRWKLADENGDTLLTKQEFKHLLHPDEGHEELQNLFVREATEDMDLDKDGKICLTEFMKHLQVLAGSEEHNDKNWLSSQQENFGRFLDHNKDGVLDGDEIRNWLIPPKSKKFEVEAKRMLDIADSNEDFSLSVVEILENYQAFVSLLPPDFWSPLSKETSEQQMLTNPDYKDGDTASRDEL